MTKIMLVGYNPPQLVQTAKIEAAHYRMWQFLQGLLADGHPLCLCSGLCGETAAIDGAPPAWQAQVTYRPVAFGAPGWRQAMQAAHDAFEPECVVAVNFSHCLYACKLRSGRPLWMDIYGDMVTIAQAANYRARSDRGLDTQLTFLREVLRRGDVFSGCGQSQCHMLVGELAMAGRLNRHTFGYEFTRVVLPGSPPRSALARPARRTRQLLTSHGVGDDAFVVLWCGGYNTWTDVDTLFRGVEAAMAMAPRLHYVSVGASTYTGPDNVYDRFTALVAGSRFQDRFHCLGWRPWSEMESYYGESDIGINIDALHYETLYGTRTRLVEMIASGLPVITSLGAELSYLLRDAGVALTFDVGDWAKLGGCLQQSASDSEARRRMAKAAAAYAQNELSFASTTKNLRTWVRTPLRAPDKGHLTPREQVRRVEQRARSVVRQTLWRVAGSDK